MGILSELDLTTSGSVWVLSVLLLAGIGLSYFVYRRTVPPVATSLRVLLVSLRAVALTLILLLLFEPILGISRKVTEKPVVAVLVDDSASMNLTDQKVDRSQVLRELLSSNFFAKEASGYDKWFFPFSYQLFDPTSQTPDSLELNGDGTDIRRGLEETQARLAESYLTAVILVTDGSNNLGENPARFASSYPVPIYPIAVGDPSEQSDILISNYVANEIAYAGTQIPIDVLVKSSGFTGRKVSVDLMQNNQTIDSQTISLGGDGLEQKVRLQFIPEQEGVFKYEIKLPNLGGELTGINNTKSFFLKVLKSKLRVLLVAGGLSPDLRFLKRILHDDVNIELTLIEEKLKGQFYQNTGQLTSDRMASFDCIILLDYPRRYSNTAFLNQIKATLAKGKSLLQISGKNVNLKKLWELRDFLPLAAQPRQGREQSVYLNILPLGRQHPVFRLSEDEFENQEKWKELPPIFTNLSAVSPDQKAQVLAAVDIQRSEGASPRSSPLIVAASSGKRKSLAVLAYGIWRWDLLMWGIGQTNESYRTFVQNTIRWLTTLEDSKLVRVASNKEIYRSGEEVKFTAQVYFEDYQPVDGAEVSVRLSGTKGTQDLSLRNIGDGRYDGSFQVLEGGDYQFTGTAHLQGRVLGRDTGKFFVEEFSLEYQNTRMNEELLKRIASESGGVYFTSDDFTGLHDKLSFPEKHLVIRSEFEIWNKAPLLIACLVLLGLEWFIRKRKGML
ncbi:hypothetical protein MJD09_26685 [bacterium]|nr:hypothetical protein [bacterium]